MSHNLTTHLQHWRRTTLDLANERTDEFLRTGLEIVVYVSQLIGGSVEQVGGEPSSPSGGRIATALLLLWLIPTVLLSNVIGCFPSCHTCKDILERFAVETGSPIEKPKSKSILRVFSVLTESSSDPFIEALTCCGGIYTFRTWGHRSCRPRQDWPRATLTLLLAVMPIFIGIVGACLILWNLIPNRFCYRHTWSIIVLSAWLMSAFITWASYTSQFASGKFHWYFVVGKNALVAVPSIIIIFLSAYSLFNDCRR